ncbi:hypothetical protein FHS27_000342 [Rhodopirellula rubra]|uniref:Uncharacterized protein n=1 Tax=Aporhodopirellula rubra TaxID=980271 RepID=A0A7W5H3X4_9BACT|nr:hypothetical protein [Aporhodopirellula rubra]MBB3204578.1 hypothetical protein [Aporhodopirellula rubra]
MKRQPSSGIILLVVLSMLTFFSLLVAAYLVFSSQSRQASFSIATRTIKEPNANALIDEALMTLIRGTANNSHPFYGEDLLSDYYGRTDYSSLRVTAISAATNGFRSITVSSFDVSSTDIDPNDQNLVADQFDDLYAGRIITFTSGNLETNTYRVIRSFWDAGSNHRLLIDLGDSTAPAVDDRIHMNGVPRNSPGIGFGGSEISEPVIASAADSTRGIPAGIGYSTAPNDLPMALQPNHLFTTVDKGTGIRGDFDEDYDAADFNNWFLSYRHDDNTVIPSFHRPSVLNYILNIESDWSNPTATSLADPYKYGDVIASFARGTFRPFPIAEGQFVSGQTAINERFTGGSSSFALRAPLLQTTPYGTARNRLNQLAKALIEGPWDVDNDSDGIPDSVWIDLNLPLITSPEGKLLRPLVAPMIEDLSGRLNVNAHGNTQIAATATGIDDANGRWGGSTIAEDLFALRGFGYGPAEIKLPDAVDNNLIATRLGTDGEPGKADALSDNLDTIRTGARPAVHNAHDGYGFSADPYGHRGIAIGRSGDLVTAPNTASVSEAVNDPYELDPHGHLTGDDSFSEADLEAILRSYEFDIDLLPTRLRQIVNSVPNVGRLLTTISKSDDTPLPTLDDPGESLFKSLIDRIVVERGGTALTQLEINELIPPEIRLGKKIDINRPFGNGADDNLNDIIDEPAEVLRKDITGTDDDGDGNTDVADTDGDATVKGETDAFVATAGSIPTDFQNVTPHYVFDIDDPALTPIATTDPFQQDQVTGRQLLARHLYTLMLLVSKDYAFPVDKPTASTNLNFEAEYRIRRIAQWAVNVIDYRDPDSVMTRFVFDPDPFDGWNPGPPTAQNTVWGVERPELVFSESAAYHDVRVTDGTPGGGPKGSGETDDKDTDQEEYPEGSLFLELYNPRPATVGEPHAGLPRELYNSSGRLQLDKRVDDTDTTSAPVWRIAISEHHYPDTANPDLAAIGADSISAQAAENPALLRGLNTDTLSFQTDVNETDEVDGNIGTGLSLERYIVFTEVPTAIAGMSVNNTYAFVTGTNVGDNEVVPARQLERGQFFCIAPREDTRFGYKSDRTTISNQRFSYSATNGIEQYDLSSGTPLFDIQSTYGIRPKFFVAQTSTGRGLNISEPFSGYGASLPSDRPLDTLDPPPGDNLLIPRIQRRETDSDGDLTNSHNNQYDPFLGTIPEYCSAFLQRLADPTREYDVVTNPYRTVDWLPIDLTVFSGKENATTVASEEGTVPSPPKPALTDPIKTYDPVYTRRTRQRDGAVLDGIGGRITGENALYSYETTLAAPSVLIATDDDFFSFNAPVNNPNAHILSSFGFLNTNEVPVNAGFTGFSTAFRGTIDENGDSTPDPTMDQNLPVTPYAMHPWLNRPFATPFELLMVPACSSGRLFEEFNTLSADPINYPDDPVDRLQFRGAFRHLLNFFHSDRVPAEGADFARILEMVETLPPYRGEVSYIHPNRLTDELSPLMRPPFNFLRNGSRNGTVNINTIAEPEVWDGLLDGHVQTNTGRLSFTDLAESRRSYTLPSTGVAVTGASAPFNYDTSKLNPYLPTQFAGVFRSPSRGNLFPKLIDATTQADARRRSVNSSLLRGRGTLKTSDPDQGGSADVTPFFVRENAEQLTGTHLDSESNPFMRYQTLLRMPNLASDNSQVFVVRLTLGLFEVDPNDTDSLGAEYNEAIGQNRRYRAMFIVDRSVPVGFVPGKDLNARDTVVFERFYQ